MDTKRFPFSDNMENFYQSFLIKKEKLSDYDLIITADDAAIHFVVDHYDEFFSGKPIVFFGVNDREFAQSLESFPNITGVVEAVSIPETVDLILKLQPQTKRIYAVVDQTISGQADLRYYYEIASNFPRVEFDEIDLEDYSFSEFKYVLQKLPSDSVLLLLSAYTDKNETTISFYESVDLMVSNSQVPIYHLWYHGIGQGLIGGMVVNHYIQAKTAAELSLEILGGTPVEDIPIISESPNEYVFDSKVISQYQIFPYQLPAGTTLINRNVPKFSDYKLEITFFGILFIFLVLWIFSLSRNIRQRKNAEATLVKMIQQNEQNMNAMSEGVIAVDNRGMINFTNQTIVDILGIKKLDLLGKAFSEVETLFVPETNVSGYYLDYSGEKSSPLNDIPISYTYEHPEKGKIYINYTNNPILVDGVRTGRVVTLQDITVLQNISKKLVNQLEISSSLHEIDKIITSSIELDPILSTIAKYIYTFLKFDAIAILVSSSNSGDFIQSFVLDLDYEKEQETIVALANECLKRKNVIYINDINSSKNLEVKMKEDLFTSCVTSPLISKDQVVGVMELFYKEEHEPDREWWQILYKFSEQLAIGVADIMRSYELKERNRELLVTYDLTLKGWAQALEIRDFETEKHSERVTEMTVELSKRLGIPDEIIQHIQRGALLHDVGKIGVPDEILYKPGGLSPQEWQIMRKHPTYAYQLLKDIPFLMDAIDIPYCHHERWDGSGYPRGLKGEEIPIAARIFAVIDVFDALISDRPYRSAWSIKDTSDYLVENSGILFDPQIVQAFLSMIEEKTFVE
ncbi:MAG: HD domain-containing protein [Anaerolineales bacterium]|nr:HD domain-containing protein [Anaerolineales bacterium]